jgi:type I restriction enzyme, S subunit
VKTRKVLVGEAFWFQEGPGVRKWQFTTAGIKLLNVGNILPIGELDLSKTDRCLSQKEAETRYKHFFVDEGDLVIASSGISFDDDGLLRTRGAFVERSHLPLCLNTSTIRFKSKGDADLRYFRFWLDSHEFRSQITRLVTGSAQQNFGPSHLENIQVSLPDLPEQRRIAERLDQADRLRRTRRYALELTDNFLPAAFLELFGDPSHGSKSWSMKPLDDCCEKFIDYRGRTPGYAMEGIPHVTTGCIKQHEIQWSAAKRVTEATYTAYMTRGLPRRGDVIFTTEAPLGEAAVVKTDDTFSLAQRLLLIRPGSTLLPDYLCHLLSHPCFDPQLLRFATGSTVKGISSESFRAIPFPVPPLPLQRKFAALVEGLERLRAVQRESLRQADHLFASLLHLAFAGDQD